MLVIVAQATLFGLLAWRADPTSLAAAMALTTAALVMLVARLYRQQAETREHERRFRSLIEQSHDGIAIHRDGIVLFANDAAAKIFGFACGGELAGRSLLDFIPVDSHRGADQPPWRTGDATLRAEPLRWQACTADARRITIDILSQPADWQGAPAVRSIINDVTEQVVLAERQRRQTAILSAVNDAHAIYLDETRARKSFDQLLAKILQISRCQHGVIAENVHDGTRRTAVRILAVSHSALVSHHLEDLLGAPALTAETGIARPEPGITEPGAGVPIANALHLPLQLDDEVLGRVVLANRSGGFSQALVEELSPVIHAITRIVADYRSVRRREAAEHASALKSAFLAHVNHELRTPLSGVIANLELLRGTGLTVEQRELVEASMSAGRGLLSVIGNTLDLSKIEAEELTLDPAEFDLAAMVESIRSIYLAAAREKHLALTSAIATEIPVRVIADEMRLRQILSNLLNNAVKFTHRGQISLSLAAEKIDDRSAWLHFAVEDTGIGFEPEQAENLFTPFRQATNSIARDFGGTGLGLAIARQLTQLHGGEIRCTSRPNEGSRFLVSLPVTVTQWAGNTAPVSTDLGADATGDIDRFPDGAAPRVLVVDDQTMNQKVLERQLERLNIGCDLAGDGQQALDLLAQRCYDIVIADCAMPVMDGLEMTRRLRAAEAAAARPRTTVIALTANAITGAEQDCYAAGMDAYLAKPLKLAELSAVLKRWHCGNRPAATAPATAVSSGGTEGSLDLPPIDKTDLARILGDDDPAQLERIIRTFCLSWQNSLAAIENLLARQDAEGMAEAAHAAKGTAQYAAAGRLAAATAELEAQARAENWTQAATTVRYLKSETRRLEAFLTTSGVKEHEQRKTA